ncbi:Vesicle transport v-SNARE protein [Histomonas meleagridis]|uniref:Vesicle transport v-SNARE protein n=1 Tax=Histomonas meleagridis TaxID=135588 RepID=UPI00355A669B|nr:Vesicle transport v-SNARE protein [Histomonas meleagridis]KAH0796131.1 Vesicle transport v-SNARE protein [Histomonas meleagridis]
MCNSIPEGERDFYVEEINQNLRPTYNRMMTDLRQKMQSMENDPGYKQNQQLHKNLDKQGLILDDLDQAISIGNETKQTADQTMTTLQEDRKILNNVNSNLDDIQTEGKKGQSIANKMLRRIIFNKFVLWTVVVILLALLAFTIYWKLRVVYALNVRINSATGLSANSTTYCVLSYKGQTRQTENAAGASPVWSEIMKFNNVGKDTLGIEVFDNSVSLGSASVDINNYETGVASNGIASVGNTVNISYSIHYCNTKNTPFA